LAETTEISKYAMLSPCLQYRFALSRAWKPNARVIGFILLNPSTADDKIDDPTVKKLIDFAKYNGFGGFLLANIFSLRSPDPKSLRAHRDPIGPSNDYWIQQVIRWSEQVICGWGNHGTYRQRGKEVKLLIPRAKRFVFGFNNGGQPTHPLYLSPTKRFLPWH
jgi:hypothetical protein